MKYAITLIVGFLLASCAIYSVKTPDPAIVSICVEHQGISVLTFWRKLNADGTKGQRFSVGGNSRLKLIMNTGFKKAYTETLKLDAGTYYLDSYQIDLGNSQFLISQDGAFNERNGWDDKNSKPLYVSFEVKPNQHLTLPPINIELKKVGEKYLGKFHFEDKDNIYTIGSLANQF
ncbi:hypothetical protein BKH41_08470 [Helicobacter sp. 12S02232-10]|uniref:hypothetical protein n=1 Tax=Helicobacter sp. 12S02232-10 TaxID=1476197 RepID=UPI000BA6FAA5|nr:hypothetical protein [Helicobacter sp. 12S02232-10]PAF46892.1 hypothetical protein BKH41_08470 [Helicobacter sp. 12S02232-10]